MPRRDLENLPIRKIMVDPVTMKTSAGPVIDESLDAVAYGIARLCAFLTGQGLTKGGWLVVHTEPNRAARRRAFHALRRQPRRKKTTNSVV